MDRPVAQELQQKFISSCKIPEPDQSHYKVFLSHSGIQKSFVIDLYDDFLKRLGINPFFDQSCHSLPKGEEFPDRIFEAARNCAVAVVILTKEYVTSKWPMLELLTFVEAQETSNPELKLLPVFYDNLLPSRIDDSWKEAWENMKPKSDDTLSVGRKRTAISVELCEKALRKLGKSNGLFLRNDKPQTSLREDILKAVDILLPRSSDIDTENVQGCHRLCESISKMLQENERGVYCLGLYGMGGLGKTTMCKQLCSYFGPRVFDKVCHVEIGSNETDTEKKKFKRHIKILESLLDIPKRTISNLNNAEKYVRQCLQHQQPKFIAVDNVQDTQSSHQEAESYLKWLSPGSIIIITSRSEDNLRCVNPGMRRNPLPNLDQEEAMALFLKLAVPEVAWKSLTPRHYRILKKSLRICYFSREKEANHYQDPVEGASHGESGHYHPLALRAAAAYFRDRYTEPESILYRWKDELDAKEFIDFL